MAYVRPGFEQFEEDIESWWFDVTNYANMDGDHLLDKDFCKRSTRIYEFVRDKTNREPSQLAHIGRLVGLHSGLKRSMDHDVTIVQITQAIDGVIWLVDDLRRMCLTSEKPGRRKKPETVQAERMLLKDPNIDNNTVVERTGLSAGTVRNIRSRLNLSQKPKS
ncbi:hypothetical protein NG895_12020 [Aeoliella sp. ICT_H6.2]|uniref:Uncharacterized protein n=1 Tax=Aeoliella straminimaris TaxID=2954799 RepID=A0A9X2F9Z2_9BACT|nr:hypothetical protein [Aeoliella straminimaris]MCO6044634.1 hypothetical protein [Aeoliella straminimaris]